MKLQIRSLAERHLLGPALLSAAAVPLVLLFLTTPVTRADSGKGQALFERRCTGCHRLDEVRSGPRLRHAFGRAAGSDPGYPYSDALKASHLTWDEHTLDRWLADPELVVPGNDMAFRVPAPDERTEIITYLKSLSTH